MLSRNRKQPSTCVPRIEKHTCKHVLVCIGQQTRVHVFIEKRHFLFKAILGRWRTNGELVGRIHLYLDFWLTVVSAGSSVFSLRRRYGGGGITRLWRDNEMGESSVQCSRKWSVRMDEEWRIRRYLLRDCPLIKLMFIFAFISIL